jgi:hypothetical protein
MIIGLLVKQLLRVLGLMFHSIQQFIQLVFESLIFNLREILLILQPLPRLPHEMLVVEEVTCELVVDGLSLVEAAPHESQGVTELLLLHLILLLPYESVLIIG